MRRNKFGRYFQNGKELPIEIQNQIIDLSSEGRSLRDIGRNVGVSNNNSIKKNINNYGNQMDKNVGGRPANIATEDVKLALSYYKHRKPSISAKEMRKKLIDDNITTRHVSDSMISLVLKSLNFTKKKLTVYPKESCTERILALYDAYLEVISNMNPMTLHFFDESSVIKTSGNRTYGHAPRGLNAVEFQRYASNATFTINLLHGPLGVDYFNILDGPSNGQNLVAFFLEAVQETDVNNQLKLQREEIL